ncbi:MAG TPA: hypothetical protein VE995_03225 [Gaiellaceae bacterium]|nr:hypothetical protein [Gaiellaceae bacterium]
MQVTIEAATRAEAELIAQALPVQAQARSWRGFGVVRVRAQSGSEAERLLDAVARSFHEHRLRWARVRYGDDERVFRAARRPAG